MSPDQRAARIASEQYGLLTSRDVAAAGLSPTQLKQRIQARGWIRRGRGLYALPGAPRLTWRQDAMAAVLLGGPQARSSHLTSAALHQLCRAPTLPHITVPPLASARRRLAGVHRSDIPAVDRARVDGIPCTSAARAIVECASLVDRPALEGLVDQAICDGRATEESITAALDRAGRSWPGHHLLVSVVEVWAAAIDPGSVAEVRFLRRLLEWGVERAVTQYEILDHNGGFVARVDVAIPSLRQVFEYDGDLWHGPRRYAPDELRHRRIEAAGWRIDHVSKRDLLPSSERIPAVLAAARVQLAVPRAHLGR